MFYIKHSLEPNLILKLYMARNQVAVCRPQVNFAVLFTTESQRHREILNHATCVSLCLRDPVVRHVRLMGLKKGSDSMLEGSRSGLDAQLFHRAVCGKQQCVDERPGDSLWGH